MDNGITEIRQRTVDHILARQDTHFRWAFDEQAARERPELTYYWPGYKGTLWTLIFLADIQAPVNNRQIDRSLELVTDHFYDKSNKIFTLGKSHFPVPCLNGNILYLHFYFKKPYTKKMDGVVDFFNSYQRFDDGDFKTPRSFPYFSNTSCYGKHTCFWGLTKLLRGLSFIPAASRTDNARRLIGNCIDFLLQHEVCFRSHDKDELIRKDIGALTFPGLWRGDFLEILWLLKREGIKNKRMSRALDLLRSKKQDDGSWKLDRPVRNLIIPMGQRDCVNAFITERAVEVLDFYGN
jgi:hypothetical protein